MAEEKSIKVTIEDKMLICEVPLVEPGGDEVKAKLIAYGAIKLAEEQVSIFFMQQRMNRERLVRASGPIRPLVH